MKISCTDLVSFIESEYAFVCSEISAWTSMYPQVGLVLKEATTGIWILRFECD